MLEPTAGSGDVRTLHSQHKFTPKEKGEVQNFVIEEPQFPEHRESWWVGFETEFALEGGGFCWWNDPSWWSKPVFREMGLCSHSRLQTHMTPEMFRTPLHEIALSIKLLRLGGIGQFLAKAIEPPPLDAVIEAERTLRGIRVPAGPRSNPGLGQLPPGGFPCMWSLTNCSTTSGWIGGAAYSGWHSNLEASCGWQWLVQLKKYLNSQWSVIPLRNLSLQTWGLFCCFTSNLC